MKTPLLILSLIIALTPALQARIGETPQECIARYGEPVNIDKEKNQLMFQKGSMIILTGFYEGKCDMLGMRKAEQDIIGNPVEITDNELEVLLDANAGGKVWKKTPLISMDKNWSTEDGALLASYGAINRFLIIATREWNARMEAEKAAEEKSKLDGF